MDAPVTGAGSMHIDVYASDDGWLEVNKRPVTARGDEAATWSAASVIMGAHLNHLARELAKRRKAQASGP